MVLKCFWFGFSMGKVVFQLFSVVIGRFGLLLDVNVLSAFVSDSFRWSRCVVKLRSCDLILLGCLVDVQVVFVIVLVCLHLCSFVSGML